MIHDNSEWITAIRTKHPEWFSLADRMSAIGQKIAEADRNIEKSDGLADDRVLSLLLFFRCLSNLNGAILMAERAMMIEARTLTRSCGESAICMAGIKFDVDQWKALLHDELASRKSRAKFLLKNERWLPDGDVKKLRLYVEGLEEQGKLSPLRLDEIANKAGLDIHYLLFRQLSADSAHPTVEALNRYVVEKPDGDVEEVQLVPKFTGNEISDTLSIATNFFFVACAVITEKFPDEKIQVEVGECWECYKELIQSAE